MYLTFCLQGVSIDTYIHKGSMVKFSCHGFDETGQEQCGYFVTVAWRQDPVDLCGPNADINASVFVGIYNASGTVSEVSHRQGVIIYVDANGEFKFGFIKFCKKFMKLFRLYHGNLIVSYCLYIYSRAG